ncbi:hypothetical protein SPRG_03355 [Saprolegnia parasitica CBS 223.65]|uniref:CHCH domain-containing protein n=1 Tax=Saprolegnia parasitica (strain CBS 223.65) TaxID=695850 RepID=A0A067CNR4_SAPPC|nr:hypothetical protein SPRG_03355 [Saprolegnia parasitica CBS 223.65]KDO32138.1 hypothetical protein SPRG_03355 [Saprolegnia parasitica CBS 223.65]|eukprot:XP_012197322.1 hypothetical protein SPRG_03355 [Saprolegnia parasitica CBS 223.65]
MADRPPTVLPPPQHLGSKSDFDDIEDLIERNKCAKEYYKLEDCLAEYDRNWSKCQAVVKLLRECNETRNKKQY